jgi:methionine-rich copper-binding protein CopC
MRARLFAAAAVAALPAAGLLHLRLVRAEPLANATVSRAPTAVRLWFSQPAEAAVTRVRLVGPGGAVPLGAVARGADGALGAAVRGPMPAGAYQVEWRTMAADGHAIGGRYAFRVGPAAPAPSAARP